MQMNLFDVLMEYNRSTFAPQVREEIKEKVSSLFQKLPISIPLVRNLNNIISFNVVIHLKMTFLDK